MAPVVVAALAFGAGALGVKLLSKDKPAPQALEPKTLPLVDPKGSPGLVSLLDKGRVYSVMAVFDWSKLPGAIPVTPSADESARYIHAVFGGGAGAATPTGLGFKVLSEPALMGDVERNNFFAGRPSIWLFNAQWLNDAREVKMDSALNRVFPNAQFRILPVSAPV
jgi:hypothetical protein